MNSDWALVLVDENRVGMNHIPTEVGRRAGMQWTPRDQTGVYLTSCGDMYTGMHVSKTGRATG